MGRGLLSGLAAAHAAGIAHHGLKPANVARREGRSPVLTDFGLAALTGMTALTSTGTLIGGPEYLAPDGSATTTATRRWSRTSGARAPNVAPAPWRAGRRTTGWIW
ncbi:hypothetical protein [Streptomyces buecherae]|uniref:hypothetical protein n=1 Tax=Streptomyces buecherae TaxID=2763006 RepID=UPI0037AE33A4